MKPFNELSEAEKIIYRISKVSELTLKLAKAGYANGLHNHQPRAESERNTIIKKNMNNRFTS